MNLEQVSKHESRELLPTDIISTPPAAELLLDIQHAERFWPDEIANKEIFLQQIEARRILIQRLDTVFTALPRPDLSLAAAVNEGTLRENQVADLYESLSELLSPDSEYQRILLYLPFEFLPNTQWKPTSERLQQTLNAFRMSFLTAWERQLVVHDVRANFVDGDVLEIEKRVGDLPRVVKAAHLIPKLVEAGMMTIKEVMEYLNKTDDDVLRSSIEDTLPVLQDLGWLKGNIENEVENSGEKPVTVIPLSEIISQLESAFARSESKDFGDVTPNRDTWLRQEEKRKAILRAADDIQHAIESGTSTTAFDLDSLPVSVKQAFIEGVRQAAEMHPDLFEPYRHSIESLWNTDDSNIHKSLRKLFFRLHGLGIITDEQLKVHALSMPALAGPFFENLKGMQPEILEIQKAVAAIEQDPYLTSTVFPVVLVFGSRLKGYGSETSDIDVAVFIKPGVQDDQKFEIRTRLKQLFTHKLIDQQIKEFWLQEDGQNLRVIDGGSNDWRILENFCTHVLFGAVWEGRQDIVKQLQSKILPAYFYDDGRMLHGRNARGLGIEELERDALQYRLLHKGYERFFPSYGGLKTPHAHLLDGQSTFWDSGYRQLATKLYASRVFLPKLDRKS